MGGDLGKAARTFRQGNRVLRLNALLRHPRESGDPEKRRSAARRWIPAFAGMTKESALVPFGQNSIPLDFQGVNGWRRMAPVTRRGLTLALAALVGLICATPSCGRTKRSKRPARPDAAVVVRLPDAAVRIPPRRAMALGRLLAHVPVRATWFVGMGRPVELLGGAARVWKLLAEIPDLTAPMSQVAERLKKAMAVWPPTAAHWTDLGIDPGGGVVLAGVGARSNRPGGTLALPALPYNHQGEIPCSKSLYSICYLHWPTWL